MAGKRYTAEEAANMILSMDDPESSDSVGNDDGNSSSDSEIVSQSEVESDDPNLDFAARRTTVQSSMQKRRAVRTRGGSFRCGVRTRGGKSQPIGVSSSEPPVKFVLSSSPINRDASNDESTFEDTPSLSVTNNNTDALNISSTADNSHSLTNPSQDPPTPDDLDVTCTWSNDPPNVCDFPFNENDGMLVDVPIDADPIFFMEKLLTEDFLQELVDSTNRYAESVINSSRPLRRKSVLNRWTPVSIDEMRKFVGLVIHMGLVRLPSYDKCWSKDPLYKNDFFRSVLPRERFQGILRFWHFGDRPEFVGDRLAKVRFLVNHLNASLHPLFVPGKNLSIDESMMLWRGRFVFRQYIKNKKSKYGTMNYVLTTV